MARDRLQQRRREEEPCYLRARVRCETRRKIRTDGCNAQLTGQSSDAAQGGRLLSREAVHQRRQSCRAHFRVSGSGRPEESRRGVDHEASQSSLRVPRCSPGARRTLPTYIRRSSAPRALRSRSMVSEGSARRGSRSNMRGLARRSIPRFCSSARTTAPRSTRVWRH